MAPLRENSTLKDGSPSAETMAGVSADEQSES